MCVWCPGNQKEEPDREREKKNQTESSKTFRACSIHLNFLLCPISCLKNSTTFLIYFSTDFLSHSLCLSHSLSLSLLFSFSPSLAVRILVPVLSYLLTDLFIFFLPQFFAITLSLSCVLLSFFKKSSSLSLSLFLGL